MTAQMPTRRTPTRKRPTAYNGSSLGVKRQYIQFTIKFAKELWLSGAVYGHRTPEVFKKSTKSHGGLRWFIEPYMRKARG